MVRTIILINNNDDQGLKVAICEYDYNKVVYPGSEDDLKELCRGRSKWKSYADSFTASMMMFHKDKIIVTDKMSLDRMLDACCDEEDIRKELDMIESMRARIINQYLGCGQSGLYLVDPKHYTAAADSLRKAQIDVKEA